MVGLLRKNLILFIMLFGCSNSINSSQNSDQSLKDSLSVLQALNPQLQHICYSYLQEPTCRARLCFKQGGDAWVWVDRQEEAPRTEPISLFDSQGQVKMAVGYGHVIQFFNACRGTKIKELDVRAKPSCILGFNNGYERLWVGYADGRICLWNVESGLCEQELKGHQATAINKLLLTRANHLISTAKNRIKIWDLASGECMRELKLPLTPYNPPHDEYHKPTFVRNMAYAFINGQPKIMAALENHTFIQWDLNSDQIEKEEDDIESFDVITDDRENLIKLSLIRTISAVNSPRESDECIVKDSAGKIIARGKCPFITQKVQHAFLDTVQSIPMHLVVKRSISFLDENTLAIKTIYANGYRDDIAYGSCVHLLKLSGIANQQNVQEADWQMLGSPHEDIAALSHYHARRNHNGHKIFAYKNNTGPLLVSAIKGYDQDTIEVWEYGPGEIEKYLVEGKEEKPKGNRDSLVRRVLQKCWDGISYSPRLTTACGLLLTYLYIRKCRPDIHRYIVGEVFGHREEESGLTEGQSIFKTDAKGFLYTLGIAKN